MEEDYKKLLEKIANGNAECFKFMKRWSQFTHAVDDVIDDANLSNPEKIDKLSGSLPLYTCSYYQEHAKELFHACYVASALYALSEADADIKIVGLRAYYDSCRHAANIVLLTCASIEGWPLKDIAQFAAELSTMSFVTHHDKEGNPV